MFYRVNPSKIWDRLYITSDMANVCIDTPATAIKNAEKISYVGYRFLREVLEDCFQGRHFIPLSVRQETKIKAYNLAPGPS